jgi:hypothetical protein
MSAGGPAAADSVDNIYIYYNTIYGNDDTSGDTAHGDMAGITLHASGSYNLEGIIVKNNIVQDNYNTAGSIGHELYGVKGTGSFVNVSLDYNNYYGTANTNYFIKWLGTTYTIAQWATYKSASSEDANSIITDPTLVNPGGTTAVDYKLQSSSPCINTGTNVGITTDYWGSARPQGLAVDMGAHEYMGAGGALIDEGETDMGNAYLKGTARTAFWLGLFTNASGLGETSVLTDITEPSGGGYGRIQLADGDWTESATKGIFVNLQKVFTATAAWGSVYGYFICSVQTGTAGILKAFEIFSDGPYTISDTWSVQVTPSIQIA